MKISSIVSALCLLLSIGACQSAQKVDSSASYKPVYVKVMSFNIRYGTANDGENHWRNRKGLVFEVIKEHQPAILGLQEALRFQIDEIRAVLPEYEEIGTGRDDGKTAGEYAAILYDKSRFTVADQGTFWFSDTPEIPGSKSWGNQIPRICTWGRFVDNTSGQSLYAYNVHLDHQSQASRERSVELLAKRIRQREMDIPVVVTGDFNAAEDNQAIKQLKAEPIGKQPRTSCIPSDKLVDTFRNHYPKAENVHTFNGFGTLPRSGKIDYVFSSKSVQTVDAMIIRTKRNGRYPSDHFPVTATIKLP